MTENLIKLEDGSTVETIQLDKGFKTRIHYPDGRKKDTYLYEDGTERAVMSEVYRKLPDPRTNRETNCFLKERRTKSSLYVKEGEIAPSLDDSSENVRRQDYYSQEGAKTWTVAPWVDNSDMMNVHLAAYQRFTNKKEFRNGAKKVLRHLFSASSADGQDVQESAWNTGHIEFDEMKTDSGKRIYGFKRYIKHKRRGTKFLKMPIPFKSNTHKISYAILVKDKGARKGYEVTLNEASYEICELISQLNVG